MLPCGIISNMFGAVVGRRHDGYLFAKSAIVQKMELKFQGWQNPPYLYGDSGYPLLKCLIVPFKGNLSLKEKRANKKMSRLRVAVEWRFCKIIQLFPFFDFKKNQKLNKQEVAKYYKVTTILTNCHTCLYGSQVSHYFECETPTLEEYLS